MIAARRNVLLIGGIALLALLNIWHWWPTSRSPAGNSTGGEPGTRGFRAEDFEVHAVMEADAGHGQRDPFRMVIKYVPKSVVPKGPPPPPPKTPEELAREAAQAELAQIRCVGISVRGGITQAFVVANGDSRVVTTGDKVGTRFQVEKITTEAVTIRDPETNVRGEIVISGK